MACSFLSAVYLHRFMSPAVCRGRRVAASWLMPAREVPVTVEITVRAINSTNPQALTDSS